MKTILIGIITFNGSHRVHNCLQSIQKWNDIPEGYKVDMLVVDDGSHNPKVDEMIWISQQNNAPVLFHNTNKGISKSWNAICQYGDSDYIVLLNDDILVTKNWLTCMVYFLENNPNIGTMGWSFYFAIDEDIPQILEADEPLEIKRQPLTKAWDEDYVICGDRPGRGCQSVGSCFAFTRKRYEEAGGFDEHYTSFYEENDFGTTLASLGYASYMLPYPLMYHLWGKTFQENPEVLKPQIRMNDSRRYYIEKWGGDTDVTNPKFMDKIKPQEITWLDEDLEIQREVIR